MFVADGPRNLRPHAVEVDLQCLVEDERAAYGKEEQRCIVPAVAQELVDQRDRKSRGENLDGADPGEGDHDLRQRR